MVEFVLVVPIMLILFLIIADFGRLYASALTIEAAARQAADFGSFESQYWSDASGTAEKMEHRACVAASKLPDYAGETDPADLAWTCTNPSVSYQLIDHVALGGSENCTDPDNSHPCWLEVTVQYTFHLIAPISLSLGGSQVGLPETMPITRTSIFALSDLHLEPDATPDPSASVGP